MPSDYQRPNDSPPSYGSLSEPLLNRYQDGSDGPIDRKDLKGRRTKMIIKDFIMVVVLFFLGASIMQPFVYMLNRARWAEEVAAHERMMEDHRQHWKQEETDHEARRVAHMQEQQIWLAEKAELDQWKHDLELKRKDIKWVDYSDRGCSKYSKRRHTAALGNVTAGLDPRKECERTPMYIYDRWLLPDWCEDPQICGKMIGHWDVDTDVCKPYISEYQDHGCNRPGVRVYKGKLDNIQDWDNWHAVCMTIPGFYDGKELGIPFYCSPCNGGSCGYWAEWSVEDHTCQ